MNNAYVWTPVVDWSNLGMAITEKSRYKYSLMDSSRHVVTKPYRVELQQLNGRSKISGTVRQVNNTAKDYDAARHPVIQYDFTLGTESYSGNPIGTFDFTLTFNSLLAQLIFDLGDKTSWVFEFEAKQAAVLIGDMLVDRFHGNNQVQQLLVRCRQAVKLSPTLGDAKFRLTIKMSVDTDNIEWASSKFLFCLLASYAVRSANINVQTVNGTNRRVSDGEDFEVL